MPLRVPLHHPLRTLRSLSLDFDLVFKQHLALGGQAFRNTLLDTIHAAFCRFLLLVISIGALVALFLLRKHFHGWDLLILP